MEDFNNWVNFKKHYELKSDKYNDDLSHLLHLLYLEIINENTDDNEGADFLFQLHYPAFYYPGNFYTQIFKKFKTDARYTRDDEEHIYYEDFLNAGRQLQLPGNWRYLSPPNKPTPPTKEEVPTERLVEGTESGCSNFGCAFIMWLPLVGLMGVLPGISLSRSENDFSILFVFIILWLPALFILMYQFGKNTGGQTYYKKAYTKEELALKEEARNKEYNEKFLKYNVSLKNYPTLLKQYENNKLEQQASIDKYSSEISAHILKSNMKSTVGYERTNSSPQRGSYENALFYELMKMYPNYVKVDTKVGPYYPDIAISIKDEIFIDIEVDEPYVYTTKQETHYISSGDEKRNKFFIENNWFVIRFAECQLINDMDKCVSFVDGIIQFILTGDTQHIASATDIKESFLIKRWTKEEARMMAIENIRTTKTNYRG